MVGVAHAMCLLGVGKHPLDGLFSQVIDGFAAWRQADILRTLKGILPDTAGNGFDALLGMGAFVASRTIHADVRLALVFPISLPVGGGIA